MRSRLRMKDRSSLCSGTFHDTVMRFCLRITSIDTVSPASYDRRMRIACDGDVGLRPPIVRITSPPLSGSALSAELLTTSTPSVAPK